MSCVFQQRFSSIIFYYYYLFLFLVTGCRHVTLYTFHALWCVCVYVVYDTRVYFIHWNPFHSLLDTQLLGTQLFEWLWKKTKNFRFKPLNWIRGQLDGGLHFSCNMNGFVFGFKQYVWTCQFGLHISLFIVWNQFSVGWSFDRRNRTSRTVAKKGSQISINWIVRTNCFACLPTSDVRLSNTDWLSALFYVNVWLLRHAASVPFFEFNYVEFDRLTVERDWFVDDERIRKIRRSHRISWSAQCDLTVCLGGLLAILSRKQIVFLAWNVCRRLYRR